MPQQQVTVTAEIDDLTELFVEVVADGFSGRGCGYVGLDLDSFIAAALRYPLPADIRPSIRFDDSAGVIEFTVFAQDAIGHIGFRVTVGIDPSRGSTGECLHSTTVTISTTYGSLEPFLHGLKRLVEGNCVERSITLVGD